MARFPAAPPPPSPIDGISLTDTTTGLYDRTSQSIQLGMRNGYARSLPLLAHELGHHILGHDGQSSPQEFDANAMGVEILQVWG
jgi:Zn-dependent peptidase ImmA (M78 family)